MDKKVLIAGVAAASMTMSANAESNNTSPETINTASPKVEVVKESVCSKTRLALEMEKSGLEIPQLDEENASNVIRDCIISLGLNPAKMEGVTIVENNYLPGQFQQSITLDQLGLTGVNDFTVENISDKFEGLIQKINEFQESYESKTVQYVAGDWTSRFENELAPNEDEVELLNNFIASLEGKELKPLPFVNALTGLIALSKYSQDDISELNEGEKAVLLSNVHSVISVLDAEKVQGLPSLVLPKGMIINGQELQSEKTYPSISVDKEIVQMISKAGVELPVELVNGFEDIYQEYQTILAEVKEESGNKIAKIEAKMSKITDEGKLKKGEARKQRILDSVLKVEDGFNNLPTNRKLLALEYLDKGIQLISQRERDNLLDNAMDMVQSMDSKIDDLGIYAEYLIDLGIPKDNVYTFFQGIINQRFEESKIALQKSEASLQKTLEEGKELDKIIAMQKKILEAKKQFDKNNTYASL